MTIRRFLTTGLLSTASLLAACSTVPWNAQPPAAHAVLTRRDAEASFDAGLSLLVRFYQIAVRPALSPNCQFAPSCSSYSLQCLSEHGPVLGTLMTFDRLIRCHSYAASGYGVTEVLVSCYKCDELHPAVKLFDPPDPEPPRLTAQGEYLKESAEALRKKFKDAPEEERRLFGFAVDLIVSRDCARAITELERFQNYFPRSPLTPDARRLELVARVFDRQYAHAAALPGGDPFEAFLKAYALYKLRRHRECRDVLRGHPWQSDARLLTFVSFLDEGAYEEAMAAWPEYPPRLREHHALSERSPALAGIFSAALPGAGQLYAGRPMDGLSSFLVTGLFALATYEALREDVETAAFITGGLGLVFYLSGIYGAVNAAERYNWESHRRFRQEVFEAARSDRLFWQLELQRLPNFRD